MSDQILIGTGAVIGSVIGGLKGAIMGAGVVAMGLTTLEAVRGVGLIGRVAYWALRRAVTVIRLRNGGDFAPRQEAEANDATEPTERDDDFVEIGIGEIEGEVNGGGEAEKEDHDSRIGSCVIQKVLASRGWLVEVSRPTAERSRQLSTDLE